jgi:hypothetical protein
MYDKGDKGHPVAMPNISSAKTTLKIVGKWVSRTWRISCSFHVKWNLQHFLIGNVGHEWMLMAWHKKWFLIISIISYVICGTFLILKHLLPTWNYKYYLFHYYPNDLFLNRW